VLVIIVLGIIGLIVAKEFFMASTSSWRKLASRYPSSDTMTECDACWALQTMRRGSRLKTTVQYGQGKFKWLPNIGIPPFWVGASSQGLILKRNIWNIAHRPIMIPWNQIQAREISLTDVATSMYPGKGISPLSGISKMADTVLGTQCEISVADPELLIYIQMDAASSIRRVMGNSFKSKEAR
jgi:hypothetical protein